MTIETIRAHVPAVAGTSVPQHLAELQTWASTYAQVAQFVAPLIDTPFVPAAFRPEAFAPRNERPTAELMKKARETAVASATAAVLFGAGLGFDPITSLQNVYVVGGRPGLYAAAMVAIVQAAGHDVWTEDITDSRAVVCGRRRGGPETPERVTVTIDQAKRAGWTRNAKYQSEPQSMLWARAASTVCRRIAQDALHGIGAAVEELEDSVAQQDTSGARTVRRVTSTVVEPAPSMAQAIAAVPAAPAEPVAEARPATPPPNPDRLRDAMNARFVELGVTGPGQKAKRAAVCADITGRQVAASADLTVDDFTLILDQLAGETGAALVAEVLSRGPQEQGTGEAPQQQPAAAPVEADALGVPGDDYDPTADDSWGTYDNGPAAVLDVPGDQA